MLDLKTILVVAFATTSLQAVTWLFVWRAWRHLYELKLLGAGFAAIAFGLMLMILREAEPTGWNIVLTNTIIKLGLVLLADGLARFLAQPRHAWVGMTLLVSQLIIWSIAVTVDPGNLAIRIHSSTVFTVVIMSMMCLGLMRDRTQPTLLRWITIAVLAEYMAASILQSLLEYRLPPDFESAAILANRNAWYLLQGTLFLIALFACLLFMVSSRLSADLREKNAVLSREIEARRRLENRLNASLEGERALRNERTDFMRVVSHEFRTPLAIIRNGVDMIDLVGDQSPAATRERIAGIREALDRLVALVNRFMASDRASGFQPELIRVGSLLEDIRLHFDMTGGCERLAMAAGDGDLSLFADPDMLMTILINLIDNALHYSPPDQTVDIDVREDQDRLIIRVRDRGIGIPRADLHKIGRRFYRASNMQAGTGTGLGLYTSRKLIAYHDGTLKLSANAGPGTTATLTLPLLPETIDPSSAEK